MCSLFADPPDGGATEPSENTRHEKTLLTPCFRITDKHQWVTQLPIKRGWSGTGHSKNPAGKINRHVTVVERYVAALSQKTAGKNLPACEPRLIFYA